MVVNSLKALDPNRPIREADIDLTEALRLMTRSRHAAALLDDLARRTSTVRGPSQNFQVRVNVYGDEILDRHCYSSASAHDWGTGIVISSAIWP